MRYQTIFITILFIFTTVITAKAQDFADGDGSESNPYQISTPDHLNNVRDYLDDHFILINDIDLSQDGYAEGNGWEPIGECDINMSQDCNGDPFTGVFDGNGFEIRNLTIDQPAGTELGLFGANDGFLTNITLTDAFITAESLSGTLVGLNTGQIQLSSSENLVIEGGTPYDFIPEPDDGLGGLVGSNISGSIDQSYTTGNMMPQSGAAGGLVSVNAGTITNAYSTVNVQVTDFGSSALSGLIVFNFNSVSESFATGNIGMASVRGGLIGDQGIPNGNVANSYWDIETTGVDQSGSPSNLVGTGKYTIEMKQQSTFGAYDFTDIWEIEDGIEVSYPYLQDNAQDPVPGLGTLFAEGDGTAGDPFQISTAEELDAMRVYVGINYDDLYFEQTTNIDLEEFLNDNTGNLEETGWEPIGNTSDPFMGNFDGGEYVIQNLIIADQTGEMLGLFGVVDSGTLTNIALIDVNIEGQERIGSLTAQNEGASITQSYSTGIIMASAGSAGGLVGINNNGTISDSYSIVTINGEGSGSGGLTGENNANISTSYAAGEVAGDAPDIGGLIGNNSGSVTNSYWNLDSSNQSESDGGTGLNNSEMRTQVSFDGFGFTSAWDIDEGSSYPFLTVNTQDPLPGFNPFDGEGTESDPYLISSAADLDAIRFFTGMENSSLFFEQTTDIDLEDFIDDGGSLINDGKGWIPIGTESDPFTAQFDGAGFIISNLSMNPDAGDAGLFGYNQGTLIRVGIQNVDLSDSAFSNGLGALTGVNGSIGNISQSWATGSIVSNGSRIGGLVGLNEGEISDSYAAVDVEGFAQVGGLTGRNDSGASTTTSYAAGVIEGSTSTGGVIGGNDGTATNVFFSSEIAGAFGSGTNLQESEMTRESSFSGFNFDTIWQIKDDANLSFPFLQESIQDPAPGESSNPFAAGDGSIQKPFQIETAAHLNEVRNYLGESFELISNIDLSAPEFTDGEGWEPIGDCEYNDLNGLCSSTTFHGVLDGNGFEIQNLTINRDADEIGLFSGLGYISSEGASVTDLAFTNASVQGEDYTGILAGVLGGAEPVLIEHVNIDNSSVTGKSYVGSIAGIAAGETNEIENSELASVTVFADYTVGGVLGRYNSDGYIRDIEVTDITINTNEENDFSRQLVGGIVGSGDGLQLSNVSVTGTLTAADNVIANSTIGGIAGRLRSNSELSESWVDVNIIAENDEAGGLVGNLNESIVKLSYALIDVESNSAKIGGLVGSAENNSEIMKSYSIHDMSLPNNSNGGLVGSLNNSTVDECYTSNSRLIGSNSESEPYPNVTNSYWNADDTSITNGGTGLVGFQFRQQAYYEGFDFTDTWAIGSTGLLSYPYLQDNAQNPLPKELENPFAAGDGHPDTPFEVSNADELAAIDDFYMYENAHFLQTSDIDLSSFGAWEPIAPISTAPFKGEYDGNNLQITGLNLVVGEDEGDGSVSCTGLFCSNSGVIKNIKVLDASAFVTEAHSVGLLTGENIGGEITNAEVQGTINLSVRDGFISSIRNERVGAVTGENNSEALISNVFANVTITGTAAWQIGGLAGRNDDSTIEDSRAVGTIIGSYSDTEGETDGMITVGGITGVNAFQSEILRSSAEVNIRGNTGRIGGLVGLNSSGLISKSFASGRIAGGAIFTPGGSIAGGLVGRHEGTSGVIEDSYALGTVSGVPGENPICNGPCVDIGGLIGVMVKNDAELHRSYSTGRVIVRGVAQESFGGLIGRIADGAFDYVVEDSYWNTETSGLTVSAAGVGLTTAEMQEEGGFDGFSFNPTWAIVEGESFAYLVDNEQTPLPGPPPEVDVDGNAGWRMMSMPVNNVSIRDLGLQNMVQGIPGANEFYQDEYSDIEFEDGVSSNILYFDSDEFDSNSDDPTGWLAPDDMDFEFETGQGFIWFMYDNDSGPSVPMDEFTLSLNGTPPTSDVTVSFSSDSEWILTGNPFDDNIDASELSANGLQSAAAQIWDPNLGDEGSNRVVNFTAGNTIAAWQGFWIENATASEFVIPESARTDDDATFYDQGDEAEPAPLVNLTLEGHNEEYDINTIDEAISIIFDENALTDWDIFDVRKLIPISNRYATLSLVGQRDGETIFKAQESQPLELTESIEIPAVLSLSEMGGTFTLSWEVSETIPATIELSLIDIETGNEINMHERNTYDFSANEEFETAEKSADKKSGEENGLLDSYKNIEEFERFKFVVNQTATSSEPDLDLPTDVALKQNYPNPFNPVTQIQYELPESENVRIDVFNITGKRVATILNEQKNAGRHTVSFDAGNLSSGVYLYRLRAGDIVKTKKMLLVK